jgi:AMIN domain
LTLSLTGRTVLSNTYKTFVRQWCKIRDPHLLIKGGDIHPPSVAVPGAPQATSATPTSAPEQLQAVGYAHDERVVTELRACCLRSVEADLEAKREAKRVRRVRIKYLAAIILTGLFCGGTVWLLRGRSSLFGSTITPPSALKSQQLTMSTTAATPTAATRSSALSSQPSAAVVFSPVVDAQSRAVFSEVLPGISYESGPNLVRFLVDLPEHFDLHPVALRNPDRIYFDVPTSAAEVKRKSVDLSNDFVRRIRVSPRDGGVTRIVLDLKCSCTYRFQPSSGPRHRLQIEVWPQRTPAALAPIRAPVRRIAPSPSAPR